MSDGLFGRFPIRSRFMQGVVMVMVGGRWSWEELGEGQILVNLGGGTIWEVVLEWSRDLEETLLCYFFD